MLNSIPTDNFYKFQFFAGLIVILSTLVFLFNRVQTDSSEIIKLKGLVSELEFNYDFWNRKVNLLQSKMEEEFDDSTFSSKQLQKFIQKADSISTDAKKLYSNYVNVQARKNLASKAIANTSKIVNWSILVFILGISWVAYGSWGWFFRHQKYQDIIVKYEAEIKQIELKKLRNKLNDEEI